MGDSGIAELKKATLGVSKRQRGDIFQSTVSGRNLKIFPKGRAIAMVNHLPVCCRDCTLVVVSEIFVRLNNRRQIFDASFSSGGH